MPQNANDLSFFKAYRMQRWMRKGYFVARMPVPKLVKNGFKSGSA
jgi:hypothetical protein